VGDTFSRPDLLAAVFATTAGAMAAANLFNARLVMRMGTRTISHGAMVAMVVIAGLHLAVVEGGPEGVWTFVALQAMTLACIGLANSNFSAMAMTNMGPIAGTASSVQGFVSVTGGSIIGAIVGQAFDGSAAPLAGGFLFAGAAGLVAVAVTERGRLFGRGGTSDTGAGFGRQAEDSSPPVMERK
jgi:DHA1 family bicyclomycin/chloramphenicol resistance-like MFS transporter